MACHAEHARYLDEVAVSSSPQRLSTLLKVIELLCLIIYLCPVALCQNTSVHFLRLNAWQFKLIDWCCRCWKRRDSPL